MTTVTRVGHLCRRFIRSLSRARPDDAAVNWARSTLSEEEFRLWATMSAADRRHALRVARRFAAMDGPPQEAVAGALLHDVGKTLSGLGTVERVVATVLGPRTARYRAYLDHERLGAGLLAAIGSSPVTTELVAGRGPWAHSLRLADDAE